jgi:hypothetical protein
VRIDYFMNQIQIEVLVDEHIEWIIKMVKRFGMPEGIDRFESMVKLKEYIETDIIGFEKKLT